MTAIAIAAQGLTKTYRVYDHPLDRLLEAVGRRPRHREFHALENVSFSVGCGEALGIVGENGAGKSTLLKLLAGVMTPTSGSLSKQGTIASILELGSGFHPEFTGRQNAVLNAAMLGLREPEVRERLPAILDWSELGDFVDQPVKTYSTGMAMRLGFSIATQVEPDILIIDEALSVGDGYFQKKCMDRLRELVDAGTTLFFCSHAMYYLSAFCERVLWLRQGRVEGLGPASDVIHSYETFLAGKGAAAALAGRAEAGRADAGRADAGRGEPVREGARAPRPAPARLVSSRLATGDTYTCGEPWELEVAWQTQDPGLEFHLGVGINRIDEIEVCSFGTHLDGQVPMTGRLDYHARLRLPALPLVKGDFTIYLFLLGADGLHVYDRSRLVGAFTVRSSGYAFGLIRAEHRWELGSAAPAASRLEVLQDA